MRRLAGVIALLVASSARAGDGSAVDAPKAPPGHAGGARRPDVDVYVPVPSEEHERLHFFSQRPHHAIPGTVVVNRDPYACDAHRRTFATKASFLQHLERAHHVAPDRVADELLGDDDGVLHYVGK